MRLQRSLLPAQLPSIASIDLAGRYRAGTGALEIGGDWYDVVRRPDGIVHLVVGDVAGRGVNAAILMGRLSTAFRAYALDDATAGDVLRHLLRHVGDDDMATAVCLTLDPYTGRARYASAGHPPPLLLDDDAGTTAHLDQALAPPLGFVRPEAIREEVVALPPRATLVAYTDGLVERRDEIIDDGIARLAAVVAASARSDAERWRRRCSTACWTTAPPATTSRCSWCDCSARRRSWTSRFPRCRPTSLRCVTA